MLKPALILVFVFLFAMSAFADSFLPPCPYVVKSADATKHFVMLTKPSEEDCGKRSSADAAAGKALRTKYKSSGVYENGDPNKALWTFDEDWWLGGSYLANDGSHIVRMSIFGRDPSVTAFTIYKDGKVVRSYKVNELVRDNSAISYTTSMIQWSKSLSIDDKNSTFNVETRDGISYSIDLSTGEVVRQEGGKPPAKTDEGSNTKPTTETPKGFCFGVVILFGIGIFGAFARCFQGKIPCRFS
jgi:hypothetical protein